MTTPAEIETVNQMIRTALLSDNDGTRLNTIRAASKRIEKHKLDPHTVSLGATTNATGRFKSYSADTEWKLKHENRKLIKNLEFERAEAKRYRDAHWTEHQTSIRLLEAITSQLGGPVYSDHLYSDQSLEGGVKRRWLRSGEEWMRLRAFFTTATADRDRLKDIEGELADLRASLKALAADQP